MDRQDTRTKTNSGLDIDPDSPLVLIDHIPDLLGEEHGFGGFLFDLQGRLLIRDGLAWLYTTSLAGGAWESWARPFDLSTLRPGPKRRVLVPAFGDDRAVLHHIIAVADDLIVGLYCDGLGVRAAVARKPDAEFVPDPDFLLRPEPGWETRGGGIEGCALEANGAHVLCEDTAEATVFWQGYDSYRRQERLGDLGWVRIRLDKVTRRVELLGRHPSNPLAFRHSDWLCARCGGNLGSDVTINGKRPFFYYIRPNLSEAYIGLSLSADPFFLSGLDHHIIGSVLGEETVLEKFEAIIQGNEILLFYESRFRDGSWHTGLRQYRTRTS